MPVSSGVLIALKKREPTCPNCGVKHHTDIHAVLTYLEIRKLQKRYLAIFNSN